MLSIFVSPYQVLQLCIELFFVCGQFSCQPWSEHCSLFHCVDVWHTVSKSCPRISTAAQAAPIPENGAAGKRRFLELLSHATVVHPLDHSIAVSEESLVVFCVPCLLRDQQLVTAMAVNVALWWPLRRNWRLVIVTFGRDDHLVATLTSLLELPIDMGVVIIASGGSLGVHRATVGTADVPPWMPNLPSEALLGGSGTIDVIGMPQLTYWHASIGKNTTHQVANFLFAEAKPLLCNLDCDQLVPRDWLESVLSLFEEHKQVPGMCIRCAKVDGALTGRLAYRLEDFLWLNGYDEEAPPSGGQDVDMRTRLRQYGSAKGQTKKQLELIISGEDLCGGALPNDFSDTSRVNDRGWSKVCNVDPAILQRFSLLRGGNQKAWSRMNDEAWQKFYGPRLGNKEYVRNHALTTEKVSLGAWWNIVARRLITDLLPGDGMNQRPSIFSQLDATVSQPASVAVTSVVPRAQPLGTMILGIKIDIVVVGCCELVNMRDTQNTCLGRLVHECCIFSVHTHVFLLVDMFCGSRLFACDRVGCALVIRVVQTAIEEGIPDGKRDH